MSGLLIRIKCPHCLKMVTIFLPKEGKIFTCPIGICNGQGRLHKTEGEWIVTPFFAER